MALRKTKVFRNIEMRIQWLGLEPFDWFALGGLMSLLVMFNRHALAANVLVIAFLATYLRIVKRGKPENHSLAVFEFYFLRKSFLSAAAKDPERTALAQGRR